MSFQGRSDSDLLDVSLDGDVARIVIGNPARRNAIDFAGWRALATLIDEVGRSGARVVVISGSGAHFCAGADISEFETVRRDATTARAYEAANSAAFAAIRDCAVPVIAAIRGVCYGGGFGLAAACDLRIATADARFAVPAARLGLAYPLDAMIDVVKAAGDQMARYLTLTAQPIDAATALRAGFLLEVTEANAFEARVTAIAGAIARSAPLSVRASRLAIASVMTGDPGTAEQAAAAGQATFDSQDYAEGRAAFLGKREPVFGGR